MSGAKKNRAGIKSGLSGVFGKPADPTDVLAGEEAPPKPPPLKAPKKADPAPKPTPRKAQSVPETQGPTLEKAPKAEPKRSGGRTYLSLRDVQEATAPGAARSWLRERIIRSIGRRRDRPTNEPIDALNLYRDRTNNLLSREEVDSWLNAEVQRAEENLKRWRDAREAVARLGERTGDFPEVDV